MNYSNVSSKHAQKVQPAAHNFVIQLQVNVLNATLHQPVLTSMHAKEQACA